MTSPARTTPSSPTGQPVAAAPVTGRRRPIGLRMIAALKVLQGVSLAIIGLGAFRLIDPDLSARFVAWLRAVSIGTDHRVVQHLVEVVTGLSPRRLGVIATTAFAYAAVLLTEGVGLWLGLAWAEYLTVAVTASFLPFEGLALVNRFTAVRLATLVVNLAVVAYLVREVVVRRRIHRSGEQR